MFPDIQDLTQHWRVVCAIPLSTGFFLRGDQVDGDHVHRGTEAVAPFEHVRYRTNSGKHLLVLSFSQFDPIADMRRCCQHNRGAG
jgi:hypothetical protein